MDITLLLLISIVSIAIIVLFLIRKPRSAAWKTKVRQKLSGINISDSKSALLELDKLLEYTLQNKFNSRDSLGSILKSKANKFDKTDLNEIWTAHKLRNSLAHNIDFQASRSELDSAVRVLNRFCKHYSV